jgi:hypothetical protein
VNGSLRSVRDVVGDGRIVEVEVREPVVPEREAGSAPRRQRAVLGLLAVDEAVNGRDAVPLEGGQHPLRDLHARHTRRLRAVRRKVVDGHRHVHRQEQRERDHSPPLGM